jgi:peptidoglycan/xylan/chitin deacetylase (PgdA/CDA1 family)
LQAPILLYHSISSDTPRRFRPFALSPERFEAHICWLREEGFNALTIGELVRARGHGIEVTKPIVLTFDDGFVDFHETALPILRRYGMTATLYVASGYVGGISRWLDHIGAGSLRVLSWSQLAEIQQSGIEIGAHSVSHPPLDIRPVGIAREEIVASKRKLEDRLGVAVDSFAYPYGYYSLLVRNMAVAAGYRSACAVRYAISPADEDPFALSRLMVRDNTDLERLLRNTPHSFVLDRIRSRVWTIVRHSLHKVDQYAE